MQVGIRTSQRAWGDETILLSGMAELIPILPKNGNEDGDLRNPQ